MSKYKLPKFQSPWRRLPSVAQRTSPFTEPLSEETTNSATTAYADKKGKEIKQIAKYNNEHGTNFYNLDQISEYEKYLEDEQHAKEAEQFNTNRPLLSAIANSSDPVYNQSSSGYTNYLRSQGRFNAAQAMQKRDDALGTAATAASVMLPWIGSAFAGDFATYGLWGGLGKTLGGFGGSAVFEKVGERLGSGLDKQFGTGDRYKNGLGIALSFPGWGLGSKLGFGLAKRGVFAFASPKTANWLVTPGMKKSIFNDFIGGNTFGYFRKPGRIISPGFNIQSQLTSSAQPLQITGSVPLQITGEQPLQLPLDSERYYRDWAKYMNRYFATIKKNGSSESILDRSKPIRVDLKLAKNPEALKAAVKGILQQYNTFKTFAPDYREMQLDPEQLIQIDQELLNFGLNPESQRDRLRFAVEVPHPDITHVKKGERMAYSPISGGTGFWSMFQGRNIPAGSNFMHPVTIKRRVDLGSDLYSWPYAAEYSNTDDLRSRFYLGKPLYKAVQEEVSKRMEPYRSNEQIKSLFSLPVNEASKLIRENEIFLPENDITGIDDIIKSANEKLQSLGFSVAIPNSQDAKNYSDLLWRYYVARDVVKASPRDLFTRGGFASIRRKASSNVNMARKNFYRNWLASKYKQLSGEEKSLLRYTLAQNKPNSGYSGLDNPLYLDQDMSKPQHVFNLIDFEEVAPSLPAEINIPNLENVPAIVDVDEHSLMSDIAPGKPDKLPGLHLQSTMFGSPLEKRLDKNGFIKRDVLNNYLRNASKIDREIIGNVLNKYFPNESIINYNRLRALVQQALPEYDPRITTDYGSYGINGIWPEEAARYGGGAHSIDKKLAHSTGLIHPIGGDSRHFSFGPNGHYRIAIDPTDKNIYYVLENQNDYFEHKETEYQRQKEQYDEYQKYWSNPFTFLGQRWIADKNNFKYVPLSYKPEEFALSQIWPERQLQASMLEILNNNGKYFRYPTRDTAAIIEGYPEIPVNSNEYDSKLTEYLKQSNPQFRKLLAQYDQLKKNRKINDLIADPEIKNLVEQIALIKQQFKDSGQKIYPYETILQRYSAFPKYARSLGWGEPRIVTDYKGNTWYEVDVPQDYDMWERRGYKKGGIIKADYGLSLPNPVPWAWDPSTYKYISADARPKTSEEMRNAVFKQMEELRRSISKNNRPKAIGIVAPPAYGKHAKIVEDGGEVQ